MRRGMRAPGPPIFAPRGGCPHAWTGGPCPYCRRAWQLGARGLGYVDPESQPWWQIIEPSAVLTKMNELHTQNRALNQAVDERTDAVADVLGTAFVAQWAAYFGEWLVFYRENQGWFDRFSSATVNQLRTFIDRSNAFERRLRGVRIDPGTPTPEEVGGGRDVPAWGWALIAVGGVLAGGFVLWGAAKVLREGRMLGEAVT